MLVGAHLDALHSTVAAVVQPVLDLQLDLSGWTRPAKLQRFPVHLAMCNKQRCADLDPHRDSCEHDEQNANAGSDATAAKATAEADSEQMTPDAQPVSDALPIKAASLNAWVLDSAVQAEVLLCYFPSHTGFLPSRCMSCTA